MPTAFKATYSDWKLVKTRGVVQIVFEVPLAEADAAYELLGGMPIVANERWFGIAAITQEAHAKPRQTSSPDTPTGGAKREKMDWRDVQPAAQAGIRCEDAQFRAFLREEMGYSRADSPFSAAAVVREICHVNSRSEFSTDQRKRVLWHQLDSKFQAWLAKERVGA